jgi:phosphatidate cytidylyltransferase
VLRTRILTALIIAPLAVAAIYLLPLGWYALFYWIVAALGLWEWAGLLGLVRGSQRVAYLGLFGVITGLSWWLQTASLQSWSAGWFAVGLWLGVAVWALAALSVVTYPRGSALIGNPWVAGIVGLIILWAAWIALIVIRAEPGGNGANWFLWLLLLVWGADIGAYFSGRRFGRLKLASAVSPGKTWEGVAGGVLLSMTVCGMSLVLLGFSAWWLVGIAALCAVSVIGDLFESVLKRIRGVKDSGNMLPGHGGILDRIDSVLAVLPVFALILTR